jgi:ATP-dependent DNA helicase RecG
MPQPAAADAGGPQGATVWLFGRHTVLAAIANRYQAALMAPTEILAEQHFRTLERLLQGSRVRMLLLLGGAPAAERRANLAAIAAGWRATLVTMELLRRHR